MMARGVIKWFDNRKGFGFIAQEGGSDIFVHYTSLAGAGYKTLDEGDLVQYELQQTGKGPKATNVVRVAQALEAAQRQQDGDNVESSRARTPAAAAPVLEELSAESA